MKLLFKSVIFNYLCLKINLNILFIFLLPSKTLIAPQPKSSKNTDWNPTHVHRMLEKRKHSKRKTKWTHFLLQSLSKFSLFSASIRFLLFSTYIPKRSAKIFWQGVYTYWIFKGKNLICNGPIYSDIFFVWSTFILLYYVNCLIHHFPSTWEDTPLVADSFSLQNVCKMSNFVMCALQTHKEADGNPPLLLYVLIRVWKSTMFNYWPDRMPSPPSCTTPLSLSLSSLPPFLPLPRSSPLVTLLVSSRKFSLQTDTGSSAAVYLCVYFAFGMHCCVWTLKFR